MTLFAEIPRPAPAKRPRSYWVPDTSYFERCIENDSDLVELEVPSFPLPDADTLSAQWDCVSGLLQVDQGWHGAPEYYALGFVAGRWQQYWLEDEAAPLRSLPGNWGIVIGNAVGYPRNPVDAWWTARNAAVALGISGKIPAGIDKMLCIGSAGRDLEVIGGSGTPVPVVYSMDANLPGIVPAHCIEISEERFLFLAFDEGLEANPGFAIARLRPSPDAQRAIDAHYAGKWEERVEDALARIYARILPRESRLKGDILKKPSTKELTCFAGVLCCDDGRAPDVFDHAWFENDGIDEAIARSRNVYPMSAPLAQEMIDTGLSELSVLADVVEIWKRQMDAYGIGFYSVYDDASFEERLAKMSRLGRDLGIESAVKAYFDGVPPEFL